MEGLGIIEICFIWTEKAMVPHSSTLAWKIPWMEKPGKLQSMGLQSRTRLSDFAFFLSFLSLVAQMVKHLPTMREAQVQSLGREVPLGKEMATHSSILAWKIPWMEKPGRLQSMGSQGSDMTERLHFHFQGCSSGLCKLCIG